MYDAMDATVGACQKVAMLKFKWLNKAHQLSVIDVLLHQKMDGNRRDLNGNGLASQDDKDGGEFGSCILGQKRNISMLRFRKKI
jgi:hypothetical protein